MLLNCGAEEHFENPLDCREIKPVNPKGNQPWRVIGRTDAEAEALILWTPDAKSQLIGKDPVAGKDWGQEEKGKTEDGITNSMDMSLSTLREMVKDKEACMLQSLGLERVRYNWVTEQQQQKQVLARYGEIGMLAQCWWECRNWCSHYEKSVEVLQKFKIELSYDPVILLLGI